METKQILVMRKDLKVRRGKECAQASHASLAFLGRRIQKELTDKPFTGEVTIKLSPEEVAWFLSSYKKITLQVENEAELEAIHDLGHQLGLESHLIIDSGFTEFGGIPTKTCVGLGPDLSEKIDLVTKSLRLY